MASGGADKTVKILDAGTKEVLQTFNFRNGGHTGEVKSIAFSPDGEMLASGGADQQVIVYSVDRLKALFPLSDYRNAVLSLAFSPDGKCLATSSGNMANIINLKTKKPIYILDELANEHHTAFVNSVAFSPDGKYLATASTDCTVKISDIAEQKVIFILDKEKGGHDGPVESVAFSPDGVYLATGSQDQRGEFVKVFKFEDILEAAKTERLNVLTDVLDQAMPEAAKPQGMLRTFITLNGKKIILPLPIQFRAFEHNTIVEESDGKNSFMETEYNIYISKLSQDNAIKILNKLLQNPEIFISPEIDSKLILKIRKSKGNKIIVEREVYEKTLGVGDFHNEEKTIRLEFNLKDLEE